MDMTMKDGLARNIASVHANIEALDLGIFGENGGSELKQQIMAALQLVLSQAEVVFYVTLGDDEGVKGRNGEAITDCIGKCVAGDDPFGLDLAEEARLIGRHIDPMIGI